MIVRDSLWLFISTRELQNNNSNKRVLQKGDENRKAKLAKGLTFLGGRPSPVAGLTLQINSNWRGLTDRISSTAALKVVPLMGPYAIQYWASAVSYDYSERIIFSGHCHGFWGESLPNTFFSPRNINFRQPWTHSGPWWSLASGSMKSKHNILYLISGAFLLHPL